MADVLTLRAEIKAWERSFKEETGSPPTVDDIKKNPPIAEKYKQYKRLSKAATSSSSTQTQANTSTPSTPPRTTRPKQPTSALLAKSRVVQPTAPLAAFNPFSPQKKYKGKERETNGSALSQEMRSKSSSSAAHVGPRQRQPFSPEPTRPMGQTSSSRSLHLNLPPEPTSAVSRARKRLRGEPVSPSPNKDKRRRVLSQTTLPFPRLNLDAPSSSDEDEEALEGDSSFVDNSPVKSTSSGKLFPSLFEEKVVPVDLFGVKSNLGLSNYNSGSQPRKASAEMERTKSFKRVPSLKALPSAKQEVVLDPRAKKAPSRPLPKPDGLKRADILDENDISRSSSKRSLSDAEDDVMSNPTTSRARSPLLPPSPPPSTNVTSYNEAGKKKARAKHAMNKSRKKAKMDGGASPNHDSEDDEPESSTKLRIVGRNTMRQRHAANGDDDEGISDLDAVLGYTPFTGPRGVSPVETRQQEEGTVDIDLPDQLRDVLALESATSKAQSSQEDTIIKGLLYGRRVTHYDPSKGGEIWGVGEDDHDEAEAGRYTEGEDDWEGEPVPWEVAEL